jgi:hypothetical protein
LEATKELLIVESFIYSRRAMKVLAGARKLVMTTTDMRKQLELAVSLRSSEDVILWNIFAIFWAANVGLIIALFADGNLPKRNGIGIVICGAGVGITTVWSCIQRPALGHLKRFEDLMTRLERDLNIEEKYAVSASINKRDYTRNLGIGVGRARNIITWCPIAVAVLWALGVFLFYFRHCGVSLGPCLSI